MCVCVCLQKASSPEKDKSTHLWTCSVAEWPVFKAHMACNFIVECAGGEDEENCNYTRCGTGGFSLDGRCYTLKEHPHGLNGPYVSPHDARRGCSAMGASLASFSTTAEFHRVTALLWTHYAWNLIVGISLRLPGVPSMYMTTTE